MGNEITSMKVGRYQSLDLWRGLACVMIIIHHACYYVLENPAVQLHDPVSRFIFKVIDLAWFGVPVFFVVSGYCIANACDILRGRQFAARQYFFRRFRRVFPPYWIVLAIYFVVIAGISLTGNFGLFTDIHKIPDPLKLSLGQWIGNLTATEPWRFHLAGNKGDYFAGFLMGQSWTICYEEQFYAICGLALFVAPRRFFEILFGITLVVGFLSIGRVHGYLPSTEGFFFDGRWLTFAAGVLVYYRVAYASKKTARLINAIMLIIFCAAIIVSHIHPSRIRDEFCVGLVFAIVLSLLHPLDKTITSHKALRPIALCGVMCYSLYLIHWPLVKIISKSLYILGVAGAWPTLLIVVPISLVVTVSLAWIFHLNVERRFLNSPIVKTPTSSTAQANGNLTPRMVEKSTAHILHVAKK